MSAKYALLKREPASTCLDEREGRMFYVLWTYICAMAARSVDEIMLKDVRWANMRWNETSFGENDMEARLMVAEYALFKYNDILPDILLMKVDKPLLAAIAAPLGYALPGNTFSPALIEQLKQWQTMRVEDGPFWYLGVCKEGALFAFLGEKEEDEKVFIVKALESPFTKLFSDRPEQEGHPGVCIKTNLVPWKSAITYTSAMVQQAFAPGKHIALFERSQGVLKRCQSRGQVYSTLTTAASTIKSTKRSAFVPMTAPLVTSQHCEQDVTHLLTKVTYWHVKPTILESPLLNDPMMLRRVWGDGPDFIEGYKTVVTETFMVRDAQECVFCESKKQFVKCCKALHVARAAKAERKGTILYYCPKLSPQVVNDGQDTIFPNKISKYDLMNFHETVVKIPVQRELEEFRLRCLGAAMLKTLTYDRFDYVGQPISLAMNYRAIMPYGSIEFNPNNEVLVLTNSTERALVILQDIAQLCAGLTVIDPVVTSTKVSGVEKKYTHTPPVPLLATHVSCSVDMRASRRLCALFLASHLANLYKSS